jgi:hypothetical protein
MRRPGLNHRTKLEMLKKVNNTVEEVYGAGLPGYVLVTRSPFGD